MQDRTRPLDFGPPKFKSLEGLPKFAPLNLKSCSGCDLGKWLGPNVPQFRLCNNRGTSHQYFPVPLKLSKCLQIVQTPCMI